MKETKRMIPRMRNLQWRRNLQSKAFDVVTTHSIRYQHQLIFLQTKIDKTVVEHGSIILGVRTRRIKLIYHAVNLLLFLLFVCFLSFAISSDVDSFIWNGQSIIARVFRVVMHLY